MVFLKLLLLLQTSFATPLKVAIDPGHGGDDLGAVRPGAKESEVVLKIAKHLNTYLQKDPLFDSVMTRTGHTTLKLRERVQIAKRNKAKLFVSIHANASVDNRSKGMEIYIRNELKPDKDSLRLAHLENQPNVKPSKKTKGGDLKAIVDDLKRSVHLKRSYELSWHMVKNWKVPFSRPRQHAIKQGPFYVLHQDSMPSILVEVGFVSNPKESQRLKQARYQKNLARSIYLGLKEYRETLDKQTSKAL